MCESARDFIYETPKANVVSLLTDSRFVNNTIIVVILIMFEVSY